MGIEDILDDDDQEESPQAPDNSAFAKMRKDLKAAEKRAQEAEARAQELERVQRTGTISTVFSEVGLNPKWSEFFPADAESTPEAVKTWAVDKGFLQLEEEEPPPPERGFRPTVVTEAALPTAKKWTKDEFEAGMRENPTLWRQRWEDDRVIKTRNP